MVGIPTKKKMGCCEFFASYIFLLWDGLGFFGFDDNKLDRLRGKPPKWYDRFLNFRWILFNLTLTAIMVSILARQAGNVGNIKS